MIDVFRSFHGSQCFRCSCKARKKKFPIDTLIWTFNFLKKEITHHPKPEETGITTECPCFCWPMTSNGRYDDVFNA